MSNLLKEYVEKSSELKRLQEELARLESDDRLKREMEFKDRLLQLMEEFGKNTRDVLTLLSPKEAEEKTETRTRAKRRLKIYRNPHTGEEVQTRGGNHKTLKAWKEEYGDEAVTGWVVSEE